MYWNESSLEQGLCFIHHSIPNASGMSGILWLFLFIFCFPVTNYHKAADAWHLTASASQESERGLSGCSAKVSKGCNEVSSEAQLEKGLLLLMGFSFLWL
jgi:hypothetical protein